MSGRALIASRMAGLPFLQSLLAAPALLYFTNVGGNVGPPRGGGRVTRGWQLTGVGPPPIGVGHPPTDVGPTTRVGQLTGVGPPPRGVGQPRGGKVGPPTRVGQPTGVGPPPIGVGQPRGGEVGPPTSVGQPTGVGPPPIGVGHPPEGLPSTKVGQLTGVGPPPIGVGQILANSWPGTMVGVGGRVDIGRPTGMPVSVVESLFNQHGTPELAGSRISK
jgi:hypothetical protein